MEYSVASQRRPDMWILGVPVHRVGSEQILTFIRQVVVHNEKAIILNVNAHCVNLALKHAWLNELLGEAQMVHCDGDGVRLGLRILGEDPPPKVSYNVWYWEVCRFCQLHGLSMYLLGARPGVAAEAGRLTEARFPGVRIAGTHHGYFDKAGSENLRVVQGINAARPDILLTCFGMPEQERWIRDNWTKLQVHVFLSGGAALDYAAGRIAIAPSWMVRAHLEWLFRLVREPRRLGRRYVVGNPLFLGRVLLQRVKNHRPGSGLTSSVAASQRRRVSETTPPASD